MHARIDALDAKIDNIRVYTAAKHGETVSFTPSETGRYPIRLIKAVDPKTAAVSRIGTLAVQGETERRAVLELGSGKFVRKWTHLGNADPLRRATALIALAPSK